MKRVLFATAVLLCTVVATADAHRNTYQISVRMAHDKAGQWCWRYFPVDPFHQRCSGSGVLDDPHWTNPHSIVFGYGYARNHCGQLIRLKIRTQYAAHGGTQVTDATPVTAGVCKSSAARAADTRELRATVPEQLRGRAD